MFLRRPSGLPLDDQSAHDVDSVREAADSLEKDVVHTVEKEVMSYCKSLELRYMEIVFNF